MRRRLRVSSISIHADALLHARGAELLDQLAEEQRKENVLGVWVDEYVQRVRAFQTASIARDLDGDWLLFGDALRTVRLPVSEMTPEISGRCSRIFRPQREPLYLPGAQSCRSQSRAAHGKMEKDGKTPALRLIRASAPLKSWHLNSDGSATLLFEPRGDLTLESAASCALSMDGGTLTAQSEGSHSVYRRTAEKALQGNSGLSVETQRESLLNAPALMFMSAVF